MPEMSMLMPLCQALQINVNELLSGERLSEDSYSRKAEENIMNLMKETENHKKQNKRTVIGAVLIIILSFIAVLSVVVISLLSAASPAEMKQWHRYILDLFSIIPLLLAAVLTMSAAKMWRPFFRAFGIVFARREYSVWEIKESAIALRMLGNVWLTAGILSTIIALIMVGYHFDVSFNDDVPMYLWTQGVSFAISIISLAYGLLGKLLLLPIQSRLEIIAEKLKYQA